MEKVKHCFSRWPPLGQSGQCWHLIIFQNWGLCLWLRCQRWTLFSNSNLGPDCFFPPTTNQLPEWELRFWSAAEIGFLQIQFNIALLQKRQWRKRRGREGEEIEIYWHLGNSTNWKLTPSRFCHFSLNEKAGGGGDILDFGTYWGQTIHLEKSKRKWDMA